MKNIKEQMISLYQINKLGYDFMGYEANKTNGALTYHHLILPNRILKEKNIDNGAIIYRSPHFYLHTIEVYDEEIFYIITSEMIDMVIKRKLDIDNLKRINTVLEYFEKEYANKKNKGVPIVKEEYTRRLLKK